MVKSQFVFHRHQIDDGYSIVFYLLWGDSVGVSECIWMVPGTWPENHDWAFA